MTIVSERVKRHRESLRQAGLRPVQLWLPDTRSPGFAEECRRQSRLLRDDPLEDETLAFIAEAADTDDWR